MAPRLRTIALVAGAALLLAACNGDAEPEASESSDSVVEVAPFEACASEPMLTLVHPDGDLVPLDGGAATVAMGQGEATFTFTTPGLDPSTLGDPPTLTDDERAATVVITGTDIVTGVYVEAGSAEVESGFEVTGTSIFGPGGPLEPTTSQIVSLTEVTDERICGDITAFDLTALGPETWLEGSFVAEVVPGDQNASSASAAT